MESVNQRGPKVTIYGLFVPLLCIGVAIAGCGKVEKYEEISLFDSRLEEFSNLHAVDRKLLGIPQLPATTNVSVERSNGTNYDVMLHIDSKHEQRTIAFRKNNGILKWINEQVVVKGQGNRILFRFKACDNSFE
ncbi:MAG: hypothetical protein WCH39_07255, partial [Schlesneria sp.]